MNYPELPDYRIYATKLLMSKTELIQVPPESLYNADLSRKICNLWGGPSSTSLVIVWMQAVLKHSPVTPVTQHISGILDTLEKNSDVLTGTDPDGDGYAYSDTVYEMQQQYGAKWREEMLKQNKEAAASYDTQVIPFYVYFGAIISL
jgi:hypothetical protein